MNEQVGPEAEKLTAEDTTAVVDTMNAPQQAPTAPDSMELQKSRSDIEQRLENLLSLIEQKESALVYRENKLKETQSKLELRENELSKKEQQVKSQRNVSWIVLIIGALTLIFAFIIVARNRGGGTTVNEKIKKQKQKVLDKLDSQMTKWEAEINELNNKAINARDNIKEEYLKQIDSLNKQKAEAQKKLNELKGASAEAWDDLKKGVDASWEELKVSINKARSKMQSRK
ncbi:hypothetical protein JXA70_05280 [candidate division KSB1 bacterium]|nr:hypothetical protein [candidate division KSB1 bacterium]